MTEMRAYYTYAYMVIFPQGSVVLRSRVLYDIDIRYRVLVRTFFAAHICCADCWLRPFAFTYPSHIFFHKQISLAYLICYLHHCCAAMAISLPTSLTGGYRRYQVGVAKFFTATSGDPTELFVAGFQSTSR